DGRLAARIGRTGANDGRRRRVALRAGGERAGEGRRLQDARSARSEARGRERVCRVDFQVLCRYEWAPVKQNVHGAGHGPAAAAYGKHRPADVRVESGKRGKLRPTQNRRVEDQADDGTDRDAGAARRGNGRGNGGHGSIRVGGVGSAKKLL